MRLKNLESLSPYRYKRSTLAESLLFNRLFQKDPGLTFALGSDSFSIALEPGAAGDWTPSPLIAHVHLDTRLAFEMRLEEQTLAMMLADIASVQDLMSLSEDLRCAAMEAALEKILDRVDYFSGAKSTIDRMSDAALDGNHGFDICFRLVRTRDGKFGRGQLRTDRAGLEWIVARWSRLSSKAVRLCDHIPVTGRIDIGRVRVTPAEINSLEPFDVILAEEVAAWNDRRVFIDFSPSLRLAGNMLQPDRFLIQDLVQGEREANHMTELKTNAAAATQWPVEDIPVDLVFEIGRTEMLMGELRRLQPGYTVQLQEQVDVSKPVTIKANGVPVGRGEIVLIDDRLGIRVLEFSQDIGPGANG